jgi:hypothetical protein
MEHYCTPKVNTLRLNIVRNSSDTRTRLNRTVAEHSLVYNSSNWTSCGNLPTLTPILAVRKLPNTRRDNPSSGYRFTCTPQQHLGVYIINPPFTSPDNRMSSPSTIALRITSNLYSFSDPTPPSSSSSLAQLYSNDSQITLSLYQSKFEGYRTHYYGNQLLLVYIVARQWS